MADDPTAALPSTMDAVPPSATRAPTPLPVPRDGARTLDSATVSMYLRDPRLAITEAGVVCLVCGRSLRHLTNTHLRRHALTSEEYKRQFGYNIDIERETWFAIGHAGHGSYDSIMYAVCLQEVGEFLHQIVW